jgi:dihydropteroate synthase
MGILNLTPDSFSDGGLHQSPDAAFARARQMVEEGCAIVDIGAESTRPGNTPVNEPDEIDRLLPVLERIIDGVDAPISIDTTKAKVAMIACRLGVVLVNDVWGLQKDPAIADVAAEFEAGVVITHNRVGKLAADYGLPVLIGASRKRFLGSLTGDGSEGRLVGSIAVNLAAAAAGAAIFRVHDVAENVAALKLFARLRAAAG